MIESIIYYAFLSLCAILAFPIIVIGIVLLYSTMFELIQTMRKK